MSIARLALRMATRKALIGATFAQERVFDSAITEIDMTVVEKRKALIVVTTDDEEGSVDGRDILGADRTIDLVIEIAVATMVKTDTGTVEVTIPDTDEGLEVTIDLMCRQVIRVLQAGTGPWADLWRRLAVSVSRVVQRRGADARQGVRFAARQIVLTLTTISDPIAPPTTGMPLFDFLAMADADDELSPVAMILRAELANTDPGSVIDAGRMGFTFADAEGTGLASLSDTGLDVLVTAGALGVGAPYEDEADVDAQLPEPP